MTKQMKKLRQLSKEEQKKKLVELKKELMKARAQQATGTTPENPGKSRSVKRTIARLYTLANQKEEKQKA